jgi:hypothetical protein
VSTTFLSSFHSRTPASQAGRANPRAAFTATSRLVYQARLAVESGMTTRANDLHNPIQDFKILGGRDPPHGLPRDSHTILKYLLRAGLFQELSCRGEANLNLSCAVNPSLVSYHVVPNQCPVLQFDLLYSLRHVTPREIEIKKALTRLSSAV